MKSLANAVSHLERNAQADLDAGEGTILLTCKTVLELCRAFRAAEKIYPKWLEACDFDLTDQALADEWDRVTGGDDR